MRTQEEILTKLQQIQNLVNSEKDPMYVQYKILVYKLSWQNALMFLQHKYRTDEQKQKWQKTSRQDDYFIKKEIQDKIDLAAMYFTDREALACMGIAVGLLTYFWLLGPKKDRALEQLWREFGATYSVENCFRGVFEGICNEMNIDWDRLKLRYKLTGDINAN